MKFRMTAHPINRKRQEELGIYHNTEVKSVSVGKVMGALLEDGHTINETVFKNETTLHFSKPTLD